MSPFCAQPELAALISLSTSTKGGRLGALFEQHQPGGLGREIDAHRGQHGRHSFHWYWAGYSPEKQGARCAQHLARLANAVGQTPHGMPILPSRKSLTILARRASASIILSSRVMVNSLKGENCFLQTPGLQLCVLAAETALRDIEDGRRLGRHQAGPGVIALGDQPEIERGAQLVLGERRDQLLAGVLVLEHVLVDGLDLDRPELGLAEREQQDRRRTSRRRWRSGT